MRVFDFFFVERVTAVDRPVDRPVPGGDDDCRYGQGVIKDDAEEDFAVISPPNHRGGGSDGDFWLGCQSGE